MHSNFRCEPTASSRSTTSAVLQKAYSLHDQVTCLSHVRLKVQVANQAQELPHSYNHWLPARGHLTGQHRLQVRSNASVYRNPGAVWILLFTLAHLVHWQCGALKVIFVDGCLVQVSRGVYKVAGSNILAQ